MPKISIIVPVYNMEKYLERCVNSMLSQTFSSFEIVLINDGSTDMSGNICDRYGKADNRIKVIHQSNRGLSEARNSGIEWVLKNSDSEWITFVDSDDWIHKDYLDTLYMTAINYNTDLAVCDCIKTSDFYFDDDSVADNGVKVFSAEDFWCFRQYGSACAKLYKKNHFNDIRFPKGLLYEDVFVTYRLIFMQKKIVYIEKPLYFYYNRPGSITHSKWNPRVLSQLDGLKQQMEFFKDNGYKSAYKITINNYILNVKQQFELCQKEKKIYMNEYIKLYFVYRYSLIKYYKYFPIHKNIKIYKKVFPRVVRIYKKYVYIKEWLVGKEW